MKTITIWLSDVEAAMLVTVQRRNRAFSDLAAYVSNLLKSEHSKLSSP